ncbi:hypothetical protein FB382_001307 [Nocardioides ginsengisegetis]|uniref:Uncharacterized protein n=1 Tax=Nocardioides ginsengisegetis TaxID=661491 RepID=A0A7W3IYI1_9ACTN|nr:hypothetical protein [Nocardioides ginsengisegetis]
MRGSLTIEEFEGRVAAALVVPTKEGLARLTSDVPGDTIALPPVQPLEVGHPLRGPRRRLWLAALAVGVFTGASATALVMHEQNKVPDHCMVMEHGKFYRVC